ncbi:hypothetical protein E5082_29945 [Streptomyces griseoluteus]|uniref:Uncharacterized protein n=1 Tax=Streptomyces griseoluteus TaxID=29306 RepID=A0A4Z1CZ48_STRGP|nr:hypothetical protein [Streptomyces griseoluteus]TGN74343.1 hypothetical protein E5082_29945 [Streptomyces griseoluteus]
MENASPLPPNVPPRPSDAPTARTTANSTDSPDGWRDEYENDPEYQRILARAEMPWWKRPVALWGGVVAVAVGSFFLGGAVLGSGDSSGTPSQDSWVQDQMDNQSQEDQQHDNQPAGISPAQKSQILSKYCKQQAGGPYNVSEAALLACLQSYEVTDQGMVMPK